MSSLCIARDKASAADTQPSPAMEPRGTTTTKDQKSPASAVHEKARPWPQWEDFVLLKSTVDGLQDKMARHRDGLQNKMIRHLDERMRNYAGLIYEEHEQLLARLVKEQVESLLPNAPTPPHPQGASDTSQSNASGPNSVGHRATDQGFGRTENDDLPKPPAPAVTRGENARVAQQAGLDESPSGDSRDVYRELERLAHQVTHQVKRMEERLNLVDCKLSPLNGCPRSGSSTIATTEPETSSASCSNQDACDVDDRVRHLESVLGVLLSDGGQSVEVDSARLRLQTLNLADVPALGWYFRALHSKQANAYSVGREAQSADNTYPDLGRPATPRNGGSPVIRSSDRGIANNATSGFLSGRTPNDSPKAGTDAQSADRAYLDHGRAATPRNGGSPVIRSSGRGIASSIASELLSGRFPNDSPTAAARMPLAFTGDVAVGSRQRSASPRVVTSLRQRSASPFVPGGTADTTSLLRPVLPRPQRDERHLMGSAAHTPIGCQTPVPPERAQGQSPLPLDRVPGQSPLFPERVPGQSPLPPERMLAVVHAQAGPALVSGSWPNPSTLGSFSLAAPPRPASGHNKVRVAAPSPHRLLAAFPGGSNSAAPLRNNSGTQTPVGTAPSWGAVPAAAATADGQKRPYLQHVPASQPQQVTQGNREDWNRAPASPFLAFEGRSIG